MLDIRNVSKRFGQLIANDNISLTLDYGEILALLGENGAGKTTLMNILFGHYTADSGSIALDGQVLPPESTSAALDAGIGMVHQHFTLADNMTVLENVMLGTESLLSPWADTDAATQKLLSIATDLQLVVNLDSLVADLTIGERQRVEILKALYRDVKVLILDEPTAVLTPQESDRLFALLRRMAEADMAIIIITHKLHEVLAVSDRVAVLRRGQLVGAADTAEVDRDTLAEMIVGRRIVRPVVDAIEAGPPVLSLNSVSVAGKVSQVPLLDAVNLEICRHQIIGLAGVSGNGQAQIAAVISGLVRADAGLIKVNNVAVKKLDPAKASGLGIARIPEDRHQSGLIGEMSVWENLLLEDLGSPPCWRGGTIINKKAARRRAAEMIDSFDIRCASMDMPASLLSGGNIQKLILARNLLKQPDFVLANQPARGLDEGAIAFVHEQLLLARNNGAGILLISEDLDELLRLSDHIVVIHQGRLTRPLNSQGLSARDLGVLMAGDTISTTATSGSDNAGSAHAI